ncbi:MAG TPA: Txe/YoeB family addiction module toxin [Candidatus Copromorpha excrementigallinarum]|uniref:Endoribonuclease YoeB n=1 Tax=Candidatus Allocopromorpha excrementigallinarum TaxID=2840742 RepID=A0A9D1HZQ4_9FIRM|nr:Txe/YoeB family addiction module toxin [Candidatus Copromorpha excrementigallinarum]
MYRILFSSRAEKDKKRLKEAGLEERAKEILNKMCEDPFAAPPAFRALKGNLAGFYSKRINIKHRLVYQVIPEERIIKVLRIWTC